MLVFYKLPGIVNYIFMNIFVMRKY